jgi:predicted phosphoribosyltransferase
MEQRVNKILATKDALHKKELEEAEIKRIAETESNLIAENELQSLRYDLRYMERSVGKQNNEIQRLQQLLAQHDIDYVE